MDDKACFLSVKADSPFGGPLGQTIQLPLHSAFGVSIIFVCAEDCRVVGKGGQETARFKRNVGCVEGVEERRERASLRHSSAEWPGG